MQTVRTQRTHVCVGDPEQPKAESLVIACLRLVHAVHGQTSAVRSSAQRWAMQRMVSTLRRVPNANRQRNMTMMQPTMKSSDIIGVWCCTPRLERMAACASAANAPATPLSASAQEVARRVAIAAAAIPSAHSPATGRREQSRERGNSGEHRGCLPSVSI